MKNTEKKTMKKTNTFREHLQRAILENCEIWDTDYNFGIWEPEFMTICVTWQLRVTLDSIRNSCDVCFMTSCSKVNIFRFVACFLVPFCSKSLKLKLRNRPKIWKHPLLNNLKPNRVGQKWLIFWPLSRKSRNGPVIRISSFNFFGFKTNNCSKKIWVPEGSPT